MSAIFPEVDPPRLGLTEDGLGTVGRHFDRYVDERKIPGFLAVVSRCGKVAHVGRGGFRISRAVRRSRPTPCFASTR